MIPDCIRFKVKRHQRAVDLERFRQRGCTFLLDAIHCKIQCGQRAIDRERLRQGGQAGITLPVRMEADEAYLGLVPIVVAMDDGATVAVVIATGALLVDRWPGASGTRGGPAAVFLPLAALAGGAMAP